MSKTKRLLSVTLAIAMIILSAFSAFAEDTETVVEPLSGTVAAGNVTVKPGVTEVEVPVTIAFKNKQTSPHGMFDISAEDATLKSATLKSFDNDNADPDAPDEKVIYIDTEGVNAEKGRVIVEAATDDLKKPLTSNVEIDVVLGFDTALEAGQVITVTIDNIQATNLFEAPWTGMEAVNGTITVEVDEPECEHAPVADSKEFVSMSDTKMVFSYVCSECGETYEVTSNIGAESGVRPGLVRSLDLGNDISINFRYKVERFADYEELVLICTKDVYEKNVTEKTTKQMVLTNYTTMTSSGTEYYQFVVSDVAAYEMVNNINAVLYAKNKTSGEYQFVWSTDYSVRDYVDSQLSSEVSSEFKTAIVDLLNYGAAAQIAGGFNVNNLANAGLSEADAALATSEYPDANTSFITEGLLSNQRPENYATLTPAGKVSVTNNIEIGNKVDLVFTINRYNDDTSYDPNALTDVYYQFEYYTALGVKTKSDFIHLNTADDDLTNGYINTAGKAVVRFSDGPLSTLSYPVTCTFYYGDPEADGQWVNMTQYSIEKYIATMITNSNADLVDMLKKMYAYGYSIAKYAGVTAYNPQA